MERSVEGQIVNMPLPATEGEFAGKTMIFFRHYHQFCEGSETGSSSKNWVFIVNNPEVLPGEAWRMQI